MAAFNIKKILVPVDFSGTGEKALRQAAIMAVKSKAGITLLHVLEGPLGKTGPDYFGAYIYNSEKYDREMMKWADKHMNTVKAQLEKELGFKVKCLIENGIPYKNILAAAKRIKADIIVMGTHGISGVREFVLGSNAFRIVSEAACPVLTIQRHINAAGFKKILLPFRDKAHSREKTDYAIAMAKMYGAVIDILGVSIDSDVSEVKKINLEAEQIKNIAEKQGVKCTAEVVKGDYLTKLIFEYARKKKSDLIVVMSDLDRMRISEYVMGPVVQQIVNHSKIPVLSIHPAYNPGAPAASGTSVSDWTFWA